MEQEPKWCRRAYENSASSRCWWFTPYDDGWEGCAAIADDQELKQIVSMEAALGEVADWASRIVQTSVRMLPPCGHYRFPLAFLECLRDIGAQRPPEFCHGCWTVDSDRKRGMQDYCLSLDAWLAGAAPEVAARELTALGHRKIAWAEVCRDLWRVLDPRSELKELLVERLLHSLRWKVKFSPWDDDHCQRFGRDRYVGDFSATGNPANADGCIAGEFPSFAEKASPRIRRLESRLEGTCPDWDWFRYTIEYGWLCAPKAFRHLECLLWAIGKEKRVIRTRDHAKDDAETVPGFLQCEDTYISQDEAAHWWRSFLVSLRAWWQGKPTGGPTGTEVARLLGEPTGVKRWLVRLMARRCELLADTSGSLGRLVSPSSSTKRGTRALSTTLQC